MEQKKQRRQPTLTLKLTLREMELLHTEMACSVGCGAEDPDFDKIREKSLAVLQKHYSRASNALAQADAACGVSPGAMG